MITLNNIDELTEEVISRIIDVHKTNELPRLMKLERYYENQNDIMRRVMNDSTKPNNKVANSYPSYITDTLVGYFIGEPITYNCENKELLKQLNNVLEYNDEADENSELAKDASIYGVAYEELYVSEEDKMLRFKRLDPKEVIPIYDKSIEENLLCVLRYYSDFDYAANKEYLIVEVIDAEKVTRLKIGEGALYAQISNSNDFELLEQYPHYFGMVPVAIYENNESRTGDFEKVISLIDAYDKMESDSLNDFEYFTDCYLALYGFTADSDDIQEMKEKRVLLMDEGTSAEWLVKNTNDQNIENMKSRLDADIHKFSKCPNLADKEFSSNASGVAIKFKLLGTENLISIKERKFKKGLQQRLELMSMINNLLGSDFDWRSIEIVFTRNIPSNDADIATLVNQLKDLVSDETLLAQIPFVDDVEAELQRVKDQKQENMEMSPFFTAQPEYKTEAMEEEKPASEEL